MFPPQLVDAQAIVDSSVKEVEDLNSQLMMFNETLCKSDLERQTSISHDLQVKLDKEKAESEDLKSQLPSRD